MAATQRLCLALDLKGDAALIEAYKDWHAPGKVPSAVVRSIREAGIADMQIYQVGDRLFMIMEVTEAFDPTTKAAADANDPDVQAWERLMWDFQRPLPFAAPGEKWLPMTRIFSLDEQP